MNVSISNVQPELNQLER